MKNKRIISLILAIVMCLSIFTFNVYADETNTVGAFLVTGDPNGYSYEGNILKISGGGNYTISMAEGVESTSNDRIEVVSDEDVTITLDGINVTSNFNTPFYINSIGNVKILLKGENSLISNNNSSAGLQKKSEENQLIITSCEGDGSTEGSVIAIGNGFGGGIGGGLQENGKNITINGGNIAAKGGDYGAAIGGGYYGSGNHITINGGNVTATSRYGAGIGGGHQGSGENITINGGSVTASGGEHGAAIGGGLYGSGEIITINGGYIKLEKGDGEYIGSGFGKNSGTNIVIKGGHFALGDINQGTVYERNVEDYCRVEDSNNTDYPYYVNNPMAFNVTGDKNGYTYENNLLKITSGGEYSISMTWGHESTDTDRIEVVSDEDVTIILDGINVTSQSNSPFNINSNGNVKILLKGENSLISNNNSSAGLQKTSVENQLIITSYEGDGSTEGSLTARSSYNGAGIGGGNEGNGVNITINGGNITAESHYDGAGIGGGFGGSGNNITINSGSVTAIGGSYGGSGIGGGNYGNGENITINGGYIKLEKEYGEYIGSGSNGAQSTDIVIRGGHFGLGDIEQGTVYEKNVENYCTVEESGNTDYPYYVNNPMAFNVTGDRNGYTYENNLLKITSGGEYSISMALGNESTDTDRIEVVSDEDVTITLDGINVTSQSNTPFNIDSKGNVKILLKGENNLISNHRESAGLQKTSEENQLIITSYEGDGSTEGSLTAKGGYQGAGIGGGDSGNGENITINGGNITAESRYDGAGIGGGNSGNGENITINGGNITAESRYDGAGIGGGVKASGENITINGGTVKASVSTYGAGIGGGRRISDIGGNGKNITINGGTVTAEGTGTGAGIGGGYNGSGENIIINGGTVKAEGAGAGTGIGGGGYDGNCKNITINGGTVTAIGGSQAGIGGGRNGNGENITINGGTVTAIAGSDGAGIGGGSYGNGKNITINGGYIKLEKNDGEFIGSGEYGEPSTNIVIRGGYFGLGDIGQGTVYDRNVEDYCTVEDSNNEDYPYYVNNPRAFNVTGDKNGYAYENNILQITSGGEYSISMAWGHESTDTDRIEVVSDEDVTITLDGINITTTWNTPFKINSKGNVKILLKGENSLISNKRDAGLEKTSEENQLIITSYYGDGSTEGSLTAIGESRGAGIGGGPNGSGVNITINGGTITAKGGNGVAGIGGGYSGSGKNITINGGNITATSDEYGAGIGGGSLGNGEDITINGGTITASGGNNGAGIGGGYTVSGKNITINGGNITASGGENGSGIGGGYLSYGESITINGGYIKLEKISGEYIGSGKYGNPSTDIVIKGGYFGLGDTDQGTVYDRRVEEEFEVVNSNVEEYPYYVKSVIEVDDSKISAGKYSVIVTEDSGSTVVYWDKNADGIVDDGDKVLKSGDLSAVNILSNGLITILGGNVAEVSGNSETTVVNIKGSPKATVDLSTIKDNAVNITGYLTSANGDIALKNPVGDVVAKASNSAYMKINDTTSVEKAFSIESKSLGAYSDNTVKVEGESNYKISAVVNGEIRDFNANDEITVNIVASGSSNVGSLQFELTGDWYTVEEVTPANGNLAEINGNKVSITGINTDITSEGVAVAEVKLKVKSDITTTENAEISFGENGNYVTPTGRLDEVVPETESTNVNIHNIKVTFSKGNTEFNTENTEAYVRYNESGLYTDTNYNSEFVIPEPTANDGYRLANRTGENLWSDGTNGYADNEALKAAKFTADSEITAQTVKTWVVTINQIDEKYGEISNYKSPITVDDNTNIHDIVKDIVYTPSVDKGYSITGWKVNGDTVPVAALETTLIKSDVDITPVAEAMNYKLSETYNENNTAITYISGIDNDKTVTYGQDITFSLAVDGNNAIYDVRYTVGEGESKVITPDNGVYTIEGSNVLGNISLEITTKAYYTVVFSSGTGNSMEDVTGYAWDNEAGLYTSVEDLGKDELTADVIKAGLKANEGYRIANDTTNEPLWNNGESRYTTEYLLESFEYIEDMDLSAVSVRQYNVAFTSGGNGSITGEVSVLVDEGKTLTELPEINADDYYSFKEWQIEGTPYTNEELMAKAIEEDTDITAIFEPSKYSITFAESEYGTFNAISGVEDDKAAYLTDVVFTFDTSESVEYVYYTVNGVKNTLAENDGSYTINGSDIKGDIAVYYETEGTAVFTFTTVNENMGILSGATGFVVDLYNYLTNEQFNKVVVEPKTGYTFTEWKISEDDILSGGAVAVPTDVIAERDVTFEAQFKLTDFNVNDSNNAVEITAGLENGYAHMGTDIVFNIKDDCVVTGVYYKIGEGEEVKLTADEDGNYTINGGNIVDDVEIITDIVEGAEFTFIEHIDYMGENIEAGRGRKIALIETDKLEKGNYGLTKGREFFYSEKYGAYAMWVDDRETAKTLNGQLTLTENEPVIINYNGDVNGSGIVTAGDAGMINDILKNQWQYIVTDSQLFMLDTETDKKVYTSDIVWVLKESIGLNN